MVRPVILAALLAIALHGCVADDGPWSGDYELTIDRGSPTEQRIRLFIDNSLAYCGDVAPILADGSLGCASPVTCRRDGETLTAVFEDLECRPVLRSIRLSYVRDQLISSVGPVDRVADRALWNQRSRCACECLHGETEECDCLLTTSEGTRTCNVGTWTSCECRPVTEVETCDVVSQTGCRPREGCYPNGSGGTACFEPRLFPGGDGGGCESQYDCSPGLGCVYDRGSRVCRPFCSVGLGECASGRDCRTLGLDRMEIGVCSTPPQPAGWYGFSGANWDGATDRTEEMRDHCGVPGDEWLRLDYVAPMTDDLFGDHRDYNTFDGLCAWIGRRCTRVCSLHMSGPTCPSRGLGWWGTMVRCD